jgi:hypothetical protein
MDKNGYNDSILQDDLSYCYVCGRRVEKLDRHEIFGGANRAKSKELGLWVMLCHQSCHLGGVHAFPSKYEYLKQKAQRVAMKHYGWNTQEFINLFGRNYESE